MATTKATNLGHRSDVTLKGTTTTIETDVVVSDTTTINNAGNDVGLKINSTSTGHIMQLQDNGTDVMVVADGGDVGIGASPDTKLNIVQSSTGRSWSPTGGQGDLIVERNGNAGISIVGANGSTSNLNFGDTDDENAGFISYDHSDNSMSLRTNGSGTDLTIDSSGKVGIGTDPSSILHVDEGSGTSGFLFDSGLRRLKIVGSNSDGGYVSLETTDQDGSNASSRNLILEPNGGNVGIGTTSSPKTELNIAANNSGQGPTLTLENTDTSITINDTIGQIDFYANDTSTNGTGAKVNIKAIATSTAGTVTALSFGTSSSASATATEAMRIDGSGKVGIQQTSPSSATGAVAVLHVGRSSISSSSVVIEDNESKWDLEVNGSLNFARSGSTKAKIDTVGDFFTNDGTVSSLSDIRVKKNVADLNDGLDIVNQLRPKTFEYNGLGEMTEAGGDGIQRYGFIADEVLEVAPHYITVGKGKIDNKEVDDMKSLSVTRMIPMMIKSIQELSAKVEALENA